MIIKRDKYVEELLSKRWNRKVKIITGIGRCGKSFLLSTLYKDYLKDEGVPEDCFIEIALDRKEHIKYRNPNELYDYVLSQTQEESKRYYVFIDEIQLSFKVKNEDVNENLIPAEDKTCSEPFRECMAHAAQFLKLAVKYNDKKVLELAEMAAYGMMYGNMYNNKFN